MGLFNVSVEFRISMHSILIFNLLLRHRNEEDILIYFLLTSAQNYICKVTALRRGWMALSNFEKTLIRTWNHRVIQLEGTTGGFLVQTRETEQTLVSQAVLKDQVLQPSEHLSAYLINLNPQYLSCTGCPKTAHNFPDTNIA